MTHLQVSMREQAAVAAVPCKNAPVLLATSLGVAQAVFEGLAVCHEH
jgi:hypothetical protein